LAADISRKKAALSKAAFFVTVVQSQARYLFSVAVLLVELEAADEVEFADLLSAASDFADVSSWRLPGTASLLLPLLSLTYQPDPLKTIPTGCGTR